MNCPKCGSKLQRNFCMRCGYMLNGNQIKSAIDNYQVSDFQRYFGNAYENVIYNKNKLLIFFLGPLYFSYRGVFWLGLLLIPFDILLCYLATFLSIETPNFIVNVFFAPINLFWGCLFIERVFYVSLANVVYLKIAKKRINKIKTKYPDNYDELLSKNVISDILKPILTILFYVCLIIIIFLIYINR